MTPRRLCHILLAVTILAAATVDATGLAFAKDGGSGGGGSGGSGGGGGDSSGSGGNSGPGGSGGNSGSGGSGSNSGSGGSGGGGSGGGQGGDGRRGANGRGGGRGPDITARDHDRARAAVASGAAKSLSAVLPTVASVAPGSIVRVNLRQDTGGNWIYSFVVLSPTGLYRDVTVDAARNVVIRNRGQ
jgi:hypothetical protein